MLINPIFERLETTYDDSEIHDNFVKIVLYKYTANDGTEFVGIYGLCFNHMTIDIFKGDSDLRTEFEKSELTI